MAQHQERLNPETGEREYVCYTCLGWKPVVAFGVNAKTHKPYLVQCRNCCTKQRNRKEPRR